MNIKDMLEKGTGLTWKELRYLKTPGFPYFIFIDDTYIRGADKWNNIIEHNLTLEYYNEVIDESYEKKIQDFLNNEDFEYKKNREWLSEEKMYMTVYEIETFLEKVVKGENKYETKKR